MSKITFTEDHISAASGNSFYTKGTQADLRGAKTLIDLGVARDGWGDIKEYAATKSASIFAKENGVDLGDAVGTGANGKITLSDVKQLVD